jgi:diaminopimelate decarboxylase
MRGFHRVGGRLTLDGVSLEEAAARFGTPLYLYSLESITESFLAYDRALSSVKHKVCYSLKANSNLSVLRLLRELGAGADVVSGFELRQALRAGFAGADIVFAGVGKTDDELELGLASGIGEFTVESESEIERLSALSRGRAARIALRVNPDIDPKSHPYISTGLRENKFGVEIGRAREILTRARNLPGIQVVGVQSHIGSQITDLGPMEAAVQALVQLSRRLLEDGFHLETIDIGGGLGVDYEGTGGSPSHEAFAARIVPHLRDLPLTLLLEPGRSIVGAAGALLTRVITLKGNGEKTFVIVDAGMNDLLRPSLYRAYHRIEPVRAPAGEPRLVDVVGPVCETGDFLARDRPLAPVSPGDLLCVRDAGAYGFCMSSTYNMRPRVAEALVDASQLRLVRRRETFEDLTATELD